MGCNPHWSLVWMTSLIQLSSGALVATIFSHHDDSIALTLILALTAVTLCISVVHLGRPAYAWRALKIWRRSWLSREVLLFGLFFITLTVLTAASWLNGLHVIPVVAVILPVLEFLAPSFGIAGILSNAYIYLVPARPAWNTLHTPIDFVLSSAVLGSAAVPLLLHVILILRALNTATPTCSALAFPLWPLILSSSLWMLNLLIRTVRLHHAPVYERRASASLLNAHNLRGVFLVSFAFIGLAILLSLAGMPILALPAAFAGVIAARYLFFVSVVPLNMALTFVRSVHA
jgi:formate dehydrogenase iron-sulfur subunit